MDIDKSMHRCSFLLQILEISKVFGTVVGDNYTPLNKLQHPISSSFLSNKTEYNRYLSSRDVPNTLFNLNKILAPLVMNRQFILVTTYKNIDIGVQDVPIILRKFEPGVWTQEPKTILWLAKLASGKNKSCKPEKHKPPIRFRPKFLRRESLCDVCLQLKFLKISSNSKPWNAQLRVVLFPPKNLMNNQQMCWYHSDNLRKRFLPSYPHFANVLISSVTQSFRSVLSQRLEKIRIEDSVWSDFYTLETRYEIFVWIEVSNLKANTFLYYAVSCFNGFVKNCPITQLNFSGNLSTKNILQQTPVSSGFGIGSYYREKLGSYVGQIVGSVSEDTMNRNLNKPVVHGTILFKKDDKVLYATIYMIYAIMKNNTYNPSTFFNRKARGTLIFWRYNKVNTHLAHVTHKLLMTLPYKTFRFVTCGHRGVKPLQFGELFSIYDIYVWLGMALCFVVTPFVLNHSYSKLIRKENKTGWKFRLVNTWIIHCKCLLEQGEPFSKSIEKTPFLRWIVASLILTSVVLSNAYKNANIYNLITKRQPLLYEHLNQVLADHFRVYTKVGRISILPFDIFGTNYYGSKLVVSNHTLSFKRKNKTIVKADFFAESEVEALHEIIDRGRWISSSELKRIQLLINNSQLHENTLGTLRNLTDAIKTLRDTDILNILSGDGFEFVFRKRELSWTTNSLLKCSKAAFILAEPECNKLAIEMKSAGSEFVSVSREVYSGVSFGWIPTGSVRPEILERIQRIQESGIVDWLAFISGNSSHQYISKSTSPKAASMSGNTLVIFVVLLIGLICSMIRFVWEKRVLIKNWCKMVITFKCNKGLFKSLMVKLSDKIKLGNLE